MTGIFDNSIQADAVDLSSITNNLKNKYLGNHLTQVLSNMQHLISMPTGCGEQNLKKFSVDIYVAKYLSAINRMPAHFLAKVKSYLLKGNE